MENAKSTYSCDICNTSVQLGPQNWTGKYIASYKMIVCDACWNGNWDGWGPTAEDKFKEHLSKNNIPLPERNTNGWYPRS